MSQYQLAKRAAKIEARRELATQLRQENAITRGIAAGAVMVLRRGFVGRVKWLLLGR